MIIHKDHKGTKKPSLKLSIHKRVAGYEVPRNHNPIHASDLTREELTFCPRMYALMDVVKTLGKKKYIGTAQRITFDIGDVYSNLIRIKWAGDLAVGTWICIKCGEVYSFCHQPEKCGSCGSSILKYEEEVFQSVSCGATGSIDMLADLGMPKLIPVEIKSIDKDYFKDLVAPKGEHWFRTRLYMRMIADSDHPHKDKINTEEALVLYISKGYGNKCEEVKTAKLHDNPFSPFKEYWVQRHDEDTEEIWQQAIILHQFRQKKGPMPEGICPTAMCKRAEICPVIGPCWSGKYPANITT